MTTARSQLIDSTSPGFYHCVSRCVRRAFLCGTDDYSGRCFEHRKQWVEDRIHELAGVFCVGIYAYAVMSNHLHVVLYLDPGAALAWSADEVATRWMRLYPVRVQGEIDEAATEMRAQVLATNPERIAVIRERLASVSWFMRSLSEPIARRANREDICTGRFWEGRFKCQALLDDAAVLACMAYVDLNPVRAGIASALNDSDHTSIKHRLTMQSESSDEHALAPAAGTVAAPLMPIGTLAYIALVDWTGRIVRDDKRGAIQSTTPPAIRNLGLDHHQWQAQVLGVETNYWRAIGAVDALIEKAKAIGQCWLKGKGVAAKLAGAASARKAVGSADK